jgi:hypothetical protein
MMTGWILALAIGAAAPPPIPPTPCHLDAEGKRANAALTFDNFDQKGSIPSSARRLGETGCWREAAEATADYLIRGPVASPGEQRILLFHLGQALALGGEEKRAADFIAATRRPADPLPPMSSPLNWNDYVSGTWAFLTKDRPMLIAARDAVLAGPGDGNRINGGLLAAMERCFDKSYLVAYDQNCGR